MNFAFLGSGLMPRYADSRCLFVLNPRFHLKVRYIETVALGRNEKPISTKGTSILMFTNLWPIM